MKLGLMQPYFFPYIGYWQLIHAVDCFILFDDVQYIRNGWINRNRILKPGNDLGWQYVIVPLVKHARTTPIRKILASDNVDWRQGILRQIDHYRKKSRHFLSIHDLLRAALFDTDDNRIAYINLAVIRRLCREMGLERKILLSSEMGFDYRDVSDAGEWALRITQQMGASQYINPVSGAPLYNPNKFMACGAEIRFLKCRSITYSQRREVFEPALSIIDVLMFNGLEGTCSLLEEYDIVDSPNA